MTGRDSPATGRRPRLGPGCASTSPSPPSTAPSTTSTPPLRLPPQVIAEQMGWSLEACL